MKLVRIEEIDDAALRRQKAFDEMTDWLKEPTHPQSAASHTQRLLRLMLVALDTNIVIYAACFNDRARSEQALALRAGLGSGRTVIPTQVIGEFFNALVTKLKWNRSEAQQVCLLLSQSASVRSADYPVFVEALASHHDIISNSGMR